MAAKKQNVDDRYRLSIPFTDEEKTALEKLAAKDSRTVTAMVKLIVMKVLNEANPKGLR